MEHPLENPSLTPFNFVLPNWQRRLKPLGPGMINGDREISLLWDAENRLSSEHRPAELIICEILPSVITVRQFESGEFFFDGRLYRRRDILVLSSFIAWLGTNVGQGFVRGHYGAKKSMVRRFDAYDEENHIVHHVLEHWPYHMKSRQRLPEATDRDRALIRAIMYWLNRTEGQTFMSKLQLRFNRMRACRMEEIRKKLALQQ